MQWQPREFNKEADDLSNGVVEGFDPDRRAVKDFGAIKWLILDNMMKFGLEFHDGR